MQFRLQPRVKQPFAAKKIIIKVILFSLIFILAIFLLNQIEISSPEKLIKQEISNEKIITIK